jgi:nicotinamidase-related amidase
MANVVLVIDMTRAFLEDGHALYCGDKARNIIPNIQRLLNFEITQGSTILFLNDHHEPDDLEFKMFPPHSITGTSETDIIPELAKYPGEIIPKTRFSAFYGTTLDDKLSQLKPEKLIVSGVCTDICVLHTVADARNRDYQVEIPIDCVASFDEAAHEWALKNMEKGVRAKLTSIGDIDK